MQCAIENPSVAQGYVESKEEGAVIDEIGSLLCQKGVSAR
jgi:hypothetical protein